MSQDTLRPPPNGAYSSEVPAPEIDLDDDAAMGAPTAPLRSPRKFSQHFSGFLQRAEFVALALFVLVAAGGLGVFSFLHHDDAHHSQSIAAAQPTPPVNSGTDIGANITAHDNQSDVTPTAPAVTPVPNADLSNQLNRASQGLSNTGISSNVPASSTYVVPPMTQVAVVPNPATVAQPYVGVAPAAAADQIVVSGGVAAHGPLTQDQPVTTASTVAQDQSVIPSGATSAQILTNGHASFLHQNSSGYLASAEHAPLAQMEVFAGTPIRAQLDDTIVSTLPGNVYAHVTYDVRASLPPYPILIPRGSTIQGRYDSAINPGEDRVMVAWDHITMPDGRTFDLLGMPGSENDGSTGMNAEVNNHKGQVYTTTFLASALSAGVQLAQPQTSSLYPTVGQTVAGAVGSQVAQTGAQMVNAQLQRPPTLTVPKGRAFMIRLSATAVLDPYYGQASGQ